MEKGSYEFPSHLELGWYWSISLLKEEFLLREQDDWSEPLLELLLEKREYLLSLIRQEP